jgi:hypothetical protein
MGFTLVFPGHLEGGYPLRTGVSSRGICLRRTTVSRHTAPLDSVQTTTFCKTVYIRLIYQNGANLSWGISHPPTADFDMTGR